MNEITKDSNLSENLKKLILTNGYTRNRSRLAQELELSEAALSHYISGRSMPTVENLIKLSQIFNVSLDYLVFGVAQSNSFTIDSSMSVARVDSALHDVVKQTEEKMTLTLEVGQQLMAKIEKEVTTAISNSERGIERLTIADEIMLEKYATKVNLMQFRVPFPLELGEDGSSPGPILRTIIENLRSEVPYHYLVMYTDQSWRPRLAAFRRNLLEGGLSQETLAANLQISWIKESVAAGTIQLYLDVKKLQTEQPMLYLKIKKYIRQRDGLLVFIPLHSNSRTGTAWTLEATYRDQECLRFQEYTKRKDLTQI